MCIIARVRRAIAWLVEMLDVNLTRSRLQGPSFAPQLIPLALRDVFLSAAGRARDLNRGAEIAVEAAPALDVQVMADPEMLAIAILNLLDNAVKFSGASGAPVHLAGASVDGNALIIVRDQGIGIPPDEVRTILGKSVRGSNARSIEGSGMGLSLVARIVAAHGGTVTIDSQVGVGPAISIILPAL